jgi:hypothetical protein
LGTAYERLAIYGLLERWCAGRPIRSALEGPLDGMAGMPGLHLLPLARSGARVTVACPDPQGREQVRRVYAARGLRDQLELADALPTPRRRFDLVLSFNALPFAADWREYLGQLVERSAGLLLLVVLNRSSYGAVLRRLVDRLTAGAPAAWADHEALEPAVLDRELQRYGRLCGVTHVDCPWWPDLLVRPGETLLGWLRQRFSLLGRAGAARRLVHDPERFPFCGAGAPPELARALARHPTFDAAPALLRRVFGHHRACLLEVSAGSHA